MALPVVPILIAVAALAIAGKKKPKNGAVTNGNGGTTNGKPEPKTISVTVEELATMGEIPMLTGDTLKVAAPEAPPSQWVLFTEAVEGEPVIVVAESVEQPAEPMPGAYGTKIFKIDAHEAGNIQADFVLAPPEESGEPSQNMASTLLKITAA